MIKVKTDLTLLKFSTIRNLKRYHLIITTCHKIIKNVLVIFSFLT